MSQQPVKTTVRWWKTEGADATTNQCSDDTSWNPVLQEIDIGKIKLAKLVLDRSTKDSNCDESYESTRRSPD